MLHKGMHKSRESAVNARQFSVGITPIIVGGSPIIIPEITTNEMKVHRKAT
jgi:hypothetical protein